ncbi:MAG: competence/damage-inducible protein A [Candidatus Omnitrophota bacterium]
MKAEIIAIGNEIMSGDIINTNVPYLSRKLTEMGVETTWHTDVSDNPAQIIEIIQRALKRSNVIITIGGLGPTGDDITVENIAAAIGRKLVFSQIVKKRIETHFKKRNLACPKINFKQARVPEGAICLNNNIGTAPGIIIEFDKNSFLIALPGPPREIEPMFENSVTPFIKKNIKIKKVILSRVIKTTGCPESKIASKINDLLILTGDVFVGSYPQIHEVDLKITARCPFKKEADEIINKIHDTLKQRLGNIIFGTDEDTLEAVTGKMLAKNKKTLSVAESCTGGLISSCITDVAGSSEYFISGVVVYSNEEKIRLLNVEKETLKKYGAVSRETAKSMAINMRELCDTDYALSVTGIAGPGGGTRAKPVGLVYIALADEKRCRVEKFFFTSARKLIKIQAAQAALNMLRKRLL